MTMIIVDGVNYGAWLLYICLQFHFLILF